MESCMTGKGFTDGCAGCTGDVAQCVYDQCSKACEVRLSDECEACYNTNCLPPFVECTGLSKDEPKLMAGGACTDAADMDLVGNLEADMVACFSSEADAAGIESCMKGKGFTANCAGCTGTYAQCVYDQCSVQCASPTSAACQNCYTAKCLPDFFTCTGLQPQAVLLAEGGKCTDEQDMALVSGIDEFHHTMVGCFESASNAQEMESCMTGKGFTDGCAGCTGDVAQCVYDQCSKACEVRLSDECEACYNTNCLPPFVECTGLSKDEPKLTAGGACTDAADMALVGNLEADMVACFSTETTTSGIESCMKGKGFTAACAGCSGTYAQCVFDKCSTDCADPTGAACKACYSAKCLPDFMSCTGLQAPAKTELKAGGACTDATDMALVADMESDMIHCFGQEQTTDGVASCMTNFGFTSGCTACMGTYAQCVLDKCSADCATDPTGSTCQSCYSSKCLPDFATCTGLSPSTIELAASEGKCTDAQDLALANAGFQDDP